MLISEWSGGAPDTRRGSFLLPFPTIVNCESPRATSLVRQLAGLDTGTRIRIRARFFTAYPYRHVYHRREAQRDRAAAEQSQDRAPGSGDRRTPRRPLR